MMGQTPPPWHGQAVATQILFEHDWLEFEVHRLRMEFSSEMVEVGRFQLKKVVLLFSLIAKARQILKANPDCLLFYPPASAKWIPFLRDVLFLSATRHLAKGTVFIYHASGLPAFASAGPIRRNLARLAYDRAEVSLEVAKEAISPHETFNAHHWQWCPCAIEVPSVTKQEKTDDAKFTALFVGSLQEGKGVLEILRTAKLLKDQGHGERFFFRVVGKWFSTAFEDEFRKLHHALELGEMVEITGQLTGDDKWRAYTGADVFFFPTHYESEATPIVLMEALGMGLPLLSTQWAGIPAMLEGCATALLHPVRSPDKYAQALVHLASKPRGDEVVADQSRAFYREHFQPERFIERVSDAFRSAARLSAPEYKIEYAPVAPTKDPSPSKLTISAYLADQNPGYDRSFGISRMTQVILRALQEGEQAEIETVSSNTSQRPNSPVGSAWILPWGTRTKWVRLLTDHFHPLFRMKRGYPDIHYFPKGYLPLLSYFCRPSVVTIHDTIIQYDADHYPKWRSRWEYVYWARMLKHTLTHADRVLTVSESSRRQIMAFMDRHGIPQKPVTVTYEPCFYEDIPQPVTQKKKGYVIHLASREPHKRTAHLIRWWHDAEKQGRSLPNLHLIGTIPPEVAPLLASTHSIVKRPFLEDSALQAVYLEAGALVLSSEIEGFGLPALEAYYLGTPVCFVKGTSVEEILSVTTTRGGFSLDDPATLFASLEDVLSMTADEVRQHGLRLRHVYAADKVAARMMDVFRGVA